MTRPDLSRHFPAYTDYTPDVPVHCVTPQPPGCIHRFYDSSPFSPSGRFIALTRLPFEDRLPGPGDMAEVVCVDLETGEMRTVAETRGWDSQLGAQVQWGRDDRTLLFNDVDTRDWRPYRRAARPARRRAPPARRHRLCGLAGRPLVRGTVPAPHREDPARLRSRRPAGARAGQPRRTGRRRHLSHRPRERCLPAAGLDRRGLRAGLSLRGPGRLSQRRLLRLSRQVEPTRLAPAVRAALDSAHAAAVATQEEPSTAQR